MAVLKRKVNSEAKGFSPYAGEDPRPGVYRARIIKTSIRKASTGRLSYNTFYELEAAKAEHKKYDGYTGFCEIYLGDESEETLQAGESAFVKAITGKSNFQNVNVAFEGKESDFDSGTGALMTALDGVKVEGKIVNINLRMEKERTHEGKKYPAELRARGVLPFDKSAGVDDEEEVDEDAFEEADDAEEIETDEAEDGEEMTDEEWEAAKEARRKELKSREYDLAKLRAVLKENGIETKGLKKEDLVEAIIGLEFPEDEDEDEEGISEDDVEPDEDDETEESDEDEEPEEDEDEPEEDDEPEADLREEIEAEAAGLDRSALKKEIKKLDATAKFTTKQTDDDLRTIFVDLKVDAPGF